MNAMRTSILAVLLVALAPVAYAQEIEPDQKYLLLATTKTSTMQKELDEAASQGFRVVVGSPTSGKEMALLLERVAQPPDIYTHKLLATNKTSTMQKELDEAAAEGFRLLPSTMIAKKTAASRFFGGDIVKLNGFTDIAAGIAHHRPCQFGDFTGAKTGFDAEEKDGAITLRISILLNRFQRGFDMCVF